MEENNRHHSRNGGIIGPALLIGAGGILLLQQMGYIQWSLWDIAFRLWPLLIIGVGLEMLIGRRSILGSLLSLMLVLGLLFGAVWMMGTGPASGAAIASQSVAYPRGTASRLSVDLIPASGNVHVDALGTEGANGLEAQIRDSNWNRIQQSSAEEIRQGKYRLQLAGSENYLIPSLGTNLWQVNLAADIPVGLNVTMGAGEMTLHLEKLHLQSLNVKMGAGQIVIYLPEVGMGQVHVSLGTGQVTIQSAKGTGLSVKCTTGLGNCILPTGSGFWERSYTSPDFDQAANRNEVDITVGAGSSSVS